MTGVQTCALPICFAERHAAALADGHRISGGGSSAPLACPGDAERVQAHLSHWLVRVTLNECKRISSHPWRSRTVPLENCQEPAFTDPVRAELFQEVMSLPAKYRVPLYLYYYEGYSVDEVGELLKLKASTVQTRLARARMMYGFSSIRKRQSNKKEALVEKRQALLPITFPFESGRAGDRKSVV